MKKTSGMIRFVLHDVAVDGVAACFPAGAVGGEGALLGQAQAAVESDPAHELRVDEVLPLAAYLPDAFVLLIPVVAHPVDEVVQVRPEVVRDGCVVLVAEVDGVHELAVDIELQLVGGSVADAYGGGATVAVEVVERGLGEVVPSVDAVDDLELAVLALVTALLQPVQEGGRFLGEADPQ